MTIANFSIAYAQDFIVDWGSPGNSKNQFHFGFGLNPNFACCGVGADPPSGITINALTGNIYVTDSNNSRIQEFTASGQFLRSWGTSCELATKQGCKAGSTAFGEGQFNNPTGIAVNPSSGNVFVADTFNSRIQEFTASGQFLRSWGTEGEIGNGKLSDPFGVTINSLTGNVYVADTTGFRVQEFTDSGQFIRAWGNAPNSPPRHGNGEFNFPYAIAVDSSSGNVYVADTDNNRIEEFDSTGGFITTWGGSASSSGSGNGLLNHPYGIAVDSHSGVVYVSDTFNSIIQKFKTGTGDFIGSFGTPGKGDGQFVDPSGIAVNSSSSTGNISLKIYVVDTSNDRIELFGTF